MAPRSEAYQEAALVSRGARMLHLLRKQRLSSLLAAAAYAFDLLAPSVVGGAAAARARE
jgi:hypothetical protein